MKKAKGKAVKKSSGQRVDGRKARRGIEKKAKKVSDRDVVELIGREDEIIEKLRKVPSVFGKLVNQLKLLYEMITDYWKGDYKEIPWFSIAIAVAAVLYFINPFDIIFDLIPGMGYIDDVLVIGLVFKSMQEELKRYCAFKGYDPDEYF